MLEAAHFSIADGPRLPHEQEVEPHSMLGGHEETLKVMGLRYIHRPISQAYGYITIINSVHQKL